MHNVCTITPNPVLLVAHNCACSTASCPGGNMCRVLLTDRWLSTKLLIRHRAVALAVGNFSVVMMFHAAAGSWSWMLVRVPLLLALNCRWLSLAIILIDCIVSLMSGIRAASTSKHALHLEKSMVKRLRAPHSGGGARAVWRRRRRRRRRRQQRWRQR
jgi:hypothetical protein